MNDLFPVPRYAGDWAIITFSCGHDGLVSAVIGRRLRSYPDMRNDWLCPVCAVVGNVVNLIGRTP